MTVSQKSPKATSFAYGRQHQETLREKYRNRHTNHWQFRLKPADDLMARYVTPRLGSRPREETVVVDVGCSIGTFAIEYSKQGYRSYGVDFDPVALEIARDLCREEGGSAEFVCGDVSDWKYGFPPIDVAICFDIFEHLHDDELGSFLTAVRKQLSDVGSLVFHTFPTQFDFLFFARRLLTLPLLPFRSLPPRLFERLVKAYAALVDVGFLATRGETYKERIKLTGHCNPSTKERLTDNLGRAGYEILYIDTSQLYRFQPKRQRQFTGQPVSHRNLYGVAIPREAP